MNMDAPWSYNNYTPSSACEISPHVPLDPTQFELESNEVISLTKELKDTPYDPELWLNRAHSVRLLGYPELSLGDAQKARLLVDAALSSSSPASSSNESLKSLPGLKEKVLKTFRKKTYDLHTTNPAWIRWADTVSTPSLLTSKVTELLQRLELQIWTELMEGLMASNCAVDYQRVSREAVARFPEDEYFPSEVVNADSWFEQRKELIEQAVEKGDMSAGSMESTLGNGGVYPVPYPWMSAENGFLGRSEEVFKGIEEDFRGVSDNCMAIRSTIRNTETSTETDCIGVISTRPITSGETILTDSMSSGTIGVDADPDGCPTCCSSPVANFWNTCCSVLYCSQVCADLSMQTFHPSICGKDFGWLHERAKLATATTDFSLDALLLLRVLAQTLSPSSEDGGVREHPLKSKVMVRLTPAYNFDIPNLIIFNFADHVVTPLTILLTLGIDIFATPSYDTWVLHTIKCRLQNNKHGQTLGGWPGTSISGLYSMLNHSCEPNVDWRHESRSCAVTMFATRNVEQGEEMCISYIGQEGNEMGVKERRRKLMGWFGMDCGCGKCVREAKEELEVGGVEKGEVDVLDEKTAVLEV